MININPIILIVASIAIGSGFYTGWSWVWKYIKSPETKFSQTFFFSMLISILIGVIIFPWLLNNQAFNMKVLAFMLLGAGAFGFMVNALINTPLSYYMKIIAKAELNLSMATLSDRAKKIIAVLGAGVLLFSIFGTSVYAAVTYTAVIRTTGNITGVGVEFYSDYTSDVPINQISWGNVYQGSSLSVPIYIKNIGNVQITLDLSTTSWVPEEVASYLTVSWNYDNSIVYPGGREKVDLTITAAQDAPLGDFSVNLVVVATG